MEINFKHLCLSKISKNEKRLSHIYPTRLNLSLIS
jgi:hypothetical protein